MNSGPRTLTTIGCPSRLSPIPSADRWGRRWPRTSRRRPPRPRSARSTPAPATTCGRRFWGGHADSYRDSVRIGVLEGLERYAGMRAGASEPSSSPRSTNLGAEALDPRDCGLYSDEFYREQPADPPVLDPTGRSRGCGAGRCATPAAGAGPGGARLLPRTRDSPNRFVQESSNGCASGGIPRGGRLLRPDGGRRARRLPARLVRQGAAAGDRRPHAAPGRGPGTWWTGSRCTATGPGSSTPGSRFRFPSSPPSPSAVDGGLGALCFGAGADSTRRRRMAAALCEIATDAVNLRARTERDETRLRAMVDDFDQVLALHDHPLLYGVPEMAATRRLPVLPSRARAGRRWRELYRRRSTGAGTGRRPARRRRQLRRRGGAAPGSTWSSSTRRCPEQRDLGLHTVKVLVPGLLPIDFGWQRQRALHLPRLRTAHARSGAARPRPAARRTSTGSRTPSRDRDATPDPPRHDRSERAHHHGFRP